MGHSKGVTTAFEKTFSQRADTEVFHELFGDIYYLSKWRCSNRMNHYLGDFEDKFNRDCKTIIQDIESKAELNPIVFFKDFSFQILPYFDENVLEFLNSIVNTFIIRSPREVLASWYRAEKQLTEEEFGGEITEEEFGFNSLGKMFQVVIEDLGQKPIVVEANRFRQNPEKILTDYCEQIGVNFDSCMLSWKNGAIKNWSSPEAKIHDYWHHTLDNSTKINPPTEVNINIREEHLSMIEKAQKIYEKMHNFAL